MLNKKKKKPISYRLFIIIFYIPICLMAILNLAKNIKDENIAWNLYVDKKFIILKPESYDEDLDEETCFLNSECD